MTQSSHAIIATPVKTNIITGFLGVGKTTAIQHLLKHKPAHERWAILVNEFGEVGIDGALHQGNVSDAVFIKEVPGGCMCCTSGLPMQIALNQLLARAKPHRLLIEPTGIGHPKEVLSTLAEPHYQDIIDLQATLTLIDARKASQSRYREHETFKDQLEVADHIVATKADLYNEQDLTHLSDYLASLHLSSTPVSVIKHGEAHPAWLDAPSRRQTQLDGQSHEHEHEHEHENHHSPLPDLHAELQRHGMVETTNKGAGFFSKGWIFTPDHIFDFYQVLDFMNMAQAERIKAVFITENGIYGFNKADGVLTTMEMDESEDSRIEFIVNSASEAEALGEALKRAILPS